MSTQSTRLLLGAVRIFETVNGYQIRRELLSWNVDRWAHIHPGSIYSVLGTLTRQGFLERHALPDGGRVVSVYTTHARGRAEFVQLVERAVTTVDLTEPLMVHTALCILPHLDRSSVQRWLETRVERIEALQLDAVTELSTPPHVDELL